MNYITITFDLTEEDFINNGVDELEKFLEEKGFVFESESGEIPSTSLIKPAKDKEDIEALMEEVINFCAGHEIGLANLLITGSAPIAHYISPDWAGHDDDEEDDED